MNLVIAVSTLCVLRMVVIPAKCNLKQMYDYLDTLLYRVTFKSRGDNREYFSLRVP